ncbi:FecR family protein [Chitinophaga niabensis]|uniref:FecR protein n=1 Tax=Chitinophaga niabensis TaxID=536979 RepID=A0A1N6J1N7_9BACT|nr:FecR family protein [Chitinophaga niabensis]SIO38172.1 FecR protein [Chitinophaga niabensis]
MDQKTFTALLEKFLSEDLSQEEVSQLLDSLQDDAMRQQWEAALGTLLHNKTVHGLSDPVRMEAVRQSIMVGKPAKKPSRIRRILPYAAAAALIAFAVTGLIYFFQPATRGEQILSEGVPYQVMPGGNKAVLTLADGSQITLDSTGNGAIANQGNVQVIKLDSGQLAYNAVREGAEGEMRYNTLATPKGGQFRVILPDGSKVWLNAASSLRFPTAFTGKEREVQLTGEAYFEIARNPGLPFKVNVKGMMVQVLGTNFNIMAYDDEMNIQTTLLEGAVKVNKGTQAVQLKPGQQAQLNATGSMSVSENVDVEGVVAWKNGYFHFNHESLEGVMRQVGRWYDAEITYEGTIPGREFGGKIGRGSDIKDVLKILELSNVHFRIEGKKIIVTP